jgi:hypothetical protein
MSARKSIEQASEMDRKLAPELWQQICLLLSGVDLNHLIRSSKYLLRVGQPSLYRTVNLEYRFSKDRDDQDTLRAGRVMELLATRTDLSGSVRELILAVNEKPSVPIPNFLTALRKMKNLRTFQSHSYLFSNEQDQIQFIEILRERSMPLLELCMLHSESDSLPHDNFQVSGLTHYCMTNTSKGDQIC